jgi:HEAT repeat protein
MDELSARDGIDILAVLHDILNRAWDKAHFPTQHANAVCYLALFHNDTQAFDLLLDVLHSNKHRTCERIRGLVAYSLQAFNDERTLYVLAHALRYHREESVQIQAAEALAQLDSPRIPDILLHFLADQSVEDLTWQSGNYRGKMRTINRVVLNWLFQLWKTHRQPENFRSFFTILQKCLYAEKKAQPIAHDILAALKLPEADAILAEWRKMQQEPIFDEQRIFQ